MAEIIIKTKEQIEEEEKNRPKTEVEKLKEELELAQEAINFLVFKNM